MHGRPQLIIEGYQVSLLSQAAANDPINFYNLAQLGLGVAAFGLVVWIVRHVTTKTIPDIVEAHEKISAQQLASFISMNKEQRTEFREILESDRQLHHQREETLRHEFREAVRDIATKAKD